MQSLYKFFLPLLCWGSLINVNAQVIGDTAVCTGDIVTYFTPPVPGGAYLWNATGGMIMGSSTADSVMINWGTPGTATLMVTVTPPNASPFSSFININIYPKPSPVITHAPYPGCPPEQGEHAGGSPDQGGGDNCEKVCKYATITYSTGLNPGSTYSWNVTGALSVTGAATNTVTVTWDASATGSLTVYETNQWGCMDSSYLCIKKMNLPLAAFTHQLSVCKFSNVQFNNLSTGAVSYQWYFGDGGSSTQFNPSHIYTNGGTYTITLIAISECFCRDTVQSTITVSSDPGPEISCPSTICAFDTATYSTSSAGCNYNWFVIGGNIVGPANQQAVTVAWGAGQMGHLGLYITGCSGLCTDTTRIDIPIVPAVANISGPQKVCPGSCEEFSLPLFSGATYTWSLNNGSCGQITDSSCCNKVQICWPPYITSCVDTLYVTYFDSFLNCGGTATFIIRVRPKLSIFGQNQGCSNGISNFFAFPGVPSNWTVTPAGPVINTSPAPSVNIDWNGLTGTFVVSASPVNPNAVCNDTAILMVTVVNPPQAPVITGDTVSCPNNTVQYCATGNGTVNWIITGGTPATSIGNCINVTWGNTPPFTVQAFTQMPLSPYCSSDTASQTVHTVISIPPAIFNGNHTACANATAGYSSAAVYLPGTSYNWTLTPPNAGAIISGQGTPVIQVEWGNNAPQTVVMSLTSFLCGLNQTDTFHIHLKNPPNPSIIQNGTLCPGVNAQLQVIGGTFTAFQWSGPGGYSSVVNPTTIALPGLYQVTVTDAGGCTALTQINVFNVGAPQASISALGPLQYCTGSSYSVGLCALGNGNYSYAWSNGPSTQCNYVSAPGSYFVTVTDLTSGCYSVSNILSVVESNCQPDTGNCVPTGSVSFTHSSCNPKVFTNNSVNATSFTWYFGDLTSSNLVNPTHYYNQAGFYTVTLYGYVPDAAGLDSCLLVDTALIEIPLLAKFSFTSGCYGSPVCFTDQSVTTAGNFINSWNWNFGDASTSSLQNPCHTYANPGTYIVTLTISNPNCTTSLTDTVVVAPPPNADFGFSNINCINTPVTFSDSSTTNINYWNWDFGNGGSSLNQNPSQSYINSGFYAVTLIVHDIYGCYDTITKNIFINAAQGSGSITASPDTVVCAGTTVILAAPACTACSYSWSTGSVNDSISVTSTGIYSVIVTDSNGCSYSTLIHVIVHQAPYAVITSPKNNLCLGEYTTLSVPWNPNWLYNWISNDPAVNGYQWQATNIFPVMSGIFTYQVAITDTVTGCSDTTLPFLLTVHTPPVAATITPLGATTVCKGDTIILVATHTDPSVTFTWSTGETNDTIFVTKNGCLSVTVTDTNGCTALTPYCVTVNPLPEVCSFWEGCYDTCAPYTIQGPPGAASYQWLLNGSPLPGDTLPFLVAMVGGAYSVIVTNVFGCIDTTGILNLSLNHCPDSLCAEVLIDSVFCDPSTGLYFLQYQVINQSNQMMSEVNLQILPPNLYVAYAPNMVYTSLNPGDTSAILTATIFNGVPGSTVCFRVHIAAYGFEGEELLCCNSDSVCFTLPECNEDTSCCYFNILHDSIWCETAPDGTVQYHVELLYEYCGEVQVSLAGEGIFDLGNIFMLSPGIGYINGIYIPGNDSLLCLTFVVHDGPVYCFDQTICFELPGCPPPGLPCLWEYQHTICQGQNAWFQYFFNIPGTTYTWQFPGGIPSSATGMGPHYINYPNPGTYPVQLIMTNAQGSTLCTDSIVVAPNPVASVIQSGNQLIAMPAGMSYQWYVSPVSPSTLIPGATNQFYTPAVTNKYCVVVTNSYGCSDTSCSFLVVPQGGCCYFNFLNDSIWCEIGPTGENQYHFSFEIEGCGNMVISALNFGQINLNNPYVMTGGITVVNGTYIPVNDNMLCLVFTVNNQITYCTDTTICFELPNCGPTPPCDIPGESFISLDESGTMLIAQPSGMSYQWYTSPVTNASLIQGATNQFYIPPFSGVYCVVITNDEGCTDTICFQFEEPGQGCCEFHYLSDSVWCETTPTGQIIRHFSIAVQGCGNIEIAPLSSGDISLNNPYVLQDDITIISGTYSSPGNTLCLLIMVHDSVSYCADTTVCLQLPDCPPVLLPCDYLKANFISYISGYTVNFVNTSTAENGMIILGSSWNFGDTLSGLSNTSSLQYPSHIFTQPGTYTVCLIVIGMYPGTNILCAKQVCYTITITDPAQSACETVQAMFNMYFSGLTGQFINQSTIGNGMEITAYHWDFGDPQSGAENISTLQNPAHQFSQPGFYTICLTITAMLEGTPITCYDTLCTDVNIVPFSVISGTVHYDNDILTPMSNTTVQLMSGSTVIKTTITDNSGHYEFDSVSPGNYRLLCSSDKPWGGVNATDGLLILKHFVGIAPLQGIRALAANVDGNSAVNATDALLATRRFVGMINYFNAGDWVFEQAVIPVGPNMNITVNVKALCYGDVNGSHNPNLKAEPSVGLDMEGTLDLVPGIESRVAVKIKDPCELSAISLVLDIPVSSFRINDISAIKDQENLMWTFDGHQLRVAWWTLDPIHCNSGDIILYLNIILPESGEFSQESCCFTIGEESSLADFDGTQLNGNTLLLPQLSVANKEFSLQQNIPNPLSDNTSIGFYLPEKGNVKLVITDVLGKAVRIYGGTSYESGSHNLNIEGSLLEEGVYFYTLYFTAEDKKIMMTRRMIVNH